MTKDIFERKPETLTDKPVYNFTGRKIFNPPPQYQTDETAEQRREDFEANDGVTQVKAVTVPFHRFRDIPKLLLTKLFNKG